MAAVTVSVGAPGHYLALETPAESAVAVAAAREVGNLAVVDVDESYVLIVPATVRTVVHKYVAAVGSPFELLVTITV